MKKRAICHPRDYEAALAEVADVGGAVRMRFDHDALGVELPTEITLASCAAIPSRPIAPATQVAFDAWLSGATSEADETSEAASIAEARLTCEADSPSAAMSLALGVVFVWPQLERPEALSQQRGLLQHVMTRSRGRGPTRVRVWQFDMDRASWANAKHDALWALGEHDDTKSLAASLLECDPHTRYDTSVVYFFAPYRLRRLQATIIREERHSFRDVAETREGAPVRRHIAMVRLASPEAIVSDVA